MKQTISKGTDLLAGKVVNNSSCELLRKDWKAPKISELDYSETNNGTLGGEDASEAS